MVVSTLSLTVSADITYNVLMEMLNSVPIKPYLNLMKIDKCPKLGGSIVIILLKMELGKL